MPICGPNLSLSSDQVAQLMRNAGFPESSIPTGVAIAKAESSWQTGNCNPNDPNGGSFGLWQINGIHFLSGTTLTCAFDPQCSTNYAFQLSNGGQNWEPWGTYTSGAYKQYLNGNAPTTISSSNNPFSSTIRTSGVTCQCPSGYHAKNIGLLGGNAQWICEKDGGNFYQGQFVKCTNDSTVNNPIDSVTNFLNSIQQLTQWLQDPVRIIKLVVGIVLVGGAIVLVASPQGQLAQSLTKVASRANVKVKPVGKASTK